MGVAKRRGPDWKVRRPEGRVVSRLLPCGAAGLVPEGRSQRTHEASRSRAADAYGSVHAAGGSRDVARLQGRRCAGSSGTGVGHGSMDD